MDLLLVSDDGLPGLIPISPPLPGDVCRDRVSDIQGNGLSWVVTQGAEHGPEVGHIALQRERDGRGYLGGFHKRK